MKQRKANFLIDLDQTLISSESTKNFKKTDKMKKFVYHEMEGQYYVFERPGLQNFLTYIFDNFNVSVCTAASKDYAIFIIKNVILGNNANRHLDYIFFSYHCRLSAVVKDKPKSLMMLWEEYKLPNYTKDNTLILDDYYDEVYAPQRSNCILAKEFEYTQEGSEKDDFLPKLAEKLRKVVSEVKVGKSVQPLVLQVNKEMNVKKK